MKSLTAKAVVAAWMALATATLHADAPAGAKKWPGPQGSTYATITQLPDWSGVWTITHDSVGKLLVAIKALEPGNPWTPHLTPVYEAKRRAYIEALHGRAVVDRQPDNNSMHCLPNGMPAMMVIPAPIGFEFLFTPGRVTLLSEESPPRRIYTDGRALPKDPDPLWMGTSIGHWEGDSTLVVDTVGFNDKTWLDRLGHPYSEELLVVERFRRVNKDHLELDITMEDPKALVKPWTTTFYYELRPNWELGEISCSGDYLDFNNFEK